MKMGIMKYSMLAGCMCLIASCGDAPTKESLEAGDSAMIEETVADTTTYNEYATMYVVITDTSGDYYELQQKMYAIGNATGLPVDTMDRVYNPTKNAVVVTDSLDPYYDEYYPRRADGAAMSIEHLSWYDTTTHDDKMKALVAAQYESKKSADSILELVRVHAPNSFVYITNMYMGCMN